MVAVEDVKFYKGGAAGLGGAINATEIITGTTNALFGIVPRNEQVIGEDYYACLYFKNTHASEQMDNFKFWLDFVSQEFNDTVIKWAFDLAGKNGTAQVITDKYTAPTNVNWIPKGSKPSTPNVGKLLKGDYFPIWVWLHVNANAVSRTDDTAGFKFALLIPGGGTGSGGTGPVDKFGIRQIYPTKTGGRQWVSNWDTTASRNFQSQGWGNEVASRDPGDAEVFIYAPTGTTIGGTFYPNECSTDGAGIMTMQGTGPAIFIKKSGQTWQNVEMTVYVRKVSTYALDPPATTDSVMKLGGPTQHDLAYLCNLCGYGYYAEVRDSGVEELLKELLHITGDADGYSDTVPILSPSHYPSGFPTNVWVGYKLLVQITDAGTHVRVKYLRDENEGVAGGDWQLILETTDTGSWGVDGPTWALGDTTDPDCMNPANKPNDSATKILMNAVNSVFFRIYHMKVNMKWASVREINALDAGPGGGTGGGGGGGNPPPTPTNWKMAIAGDWGCGSTTNTVRDLCKTYDFTVGVGDNAYAAASCWTSTFSSLKPNLNSAYGNHEYSESGGIAPYKTFFGHSLTYFSFNFQNVHVVVCDSNINMDPGSAQHNFVTSDLTSASANSAIDWIFAVMHHPWFGSSSTHSYNNGSEVQAFHSLFMSHNVAFVFTGHNHNWQRTHKVAYNAGSPTNPTVIDSAAPFVNDNTGLIHVVTGGGGHDSGSSLYGLGSQPAFQGYQNRTHNGIFEVVASNNGKTLTCSFVDQDGQNKFDTFVYTTT